MFESVEIIRGGLAYQLATPLSEELLNEIASDMVAKDPHMLSDWEWRYASQIEGCRFEVWEDGGHMMPLDSPQRLVDLLVSFIEDVSKR